MKKEILCLFIGSVLLCPYSELSAQGFLKKIAKGVENASKELDKATDKLSGAKQTTINNTSVTYSSPSNIIKVEVDKAEMQDDELIFEFILTNTSDTDIRSYEISSDYSKNSHKTFATDNLGNRTAVVVSIADRTPSREQGGLRTVMPAGVPIRAIARIGKINPKATSITQLSINGHDWSYSARKELTGSFVFKNIPIVRQETVNTDTESSSNVSESSGQSINIFEVKLGMSNWSDSELAKYKKAARLTSQERLSLKIDNIKGEILNKQLENKNLIKGKTIYQGQYGRIETLVYVFEENGSFEFKEFIISYNGSGNYVDHLKVGENYLYASGDLSTIIKGDIVKTKLYVEEDMDYPESTTYSTYRILSDLKFQKID